MARFSAKLGRLLRNFPALQFVVAKFAGLIRKHQVKAKQPGASGARAFKGFKCDGPFANAIGGIDVSQSEREKLIRRRWLETGIRMWNPEVYGPALNIQGHEGVLPIKLGQALPSYDELKFKLIGSRIVCEGVVVDPPSRHDNANSLEAWQCGGRFRN
jgi:hypothetical protein